MASNSTDEKAPLFYNYEDPTSLVASVLMLLNGVFGVICNSLIVYIFVSETKERSSFNVICVFRAVINIYILLTNHLFLFIPITLTGVQVYSKTLETWAICMANSLYIANEYMTIVIAVNRFVSLFFPVHYSMIFEIKKTLLAVSLVYAYRILAVTREIINYTALGCSVLYYVEYLSWLPDFSLECESNSGILLFMAINFTIVSIFNMATFGKVFSFYRKNAYLFIQTLMQDSLYLIDISFTFYFFSFFDNRFWTFFSGTFVWESLHSLDGFIMIMFNERLSFLKKQLFQPLASKVSFIRVSQASTGPHSNIEK
ncbi:unnamed protein product [Caenorhabditis sp. 36 PRJEB53466]|nr:unnamed protein product [Caenorhabditis sp. 36 PRJEB53466]